MDNKIFSQETIALLEALGVNQAGACQIASALYKEWIANIKDCNSTVSFDKWCMFKFEEAPYDEFNF